MAPRDKTPRMSVAGIDETIRMADLRYFVFSFFTGDNLIVRILTLNITAQAKL